jgi:hypothetical protein
MIVPGLFVYSGYGSASAVFIRCGELLIRIYPSKNNLKKDIYFQEKAGYTPCERSDKEWILKVFVIS